MNEPEEICGHKADTIIVDECKDFAPLNAELPTENPPEWKPTLPSEIEDPNDRLKVMRDLLASEANRVEVRGYEIARLNPQGEWDSIIKYKATERGLRQAKGDADWLNNRHTNSLVMVRVLVSAAIPDAPKEEPLRLDADEPSDISTPETNETAETNA